MADPKYSAHLKPAENPLDYDVFISVDDSGEVDSIWGSGFMGLGTWDPDLKRWVSISKGDPKLVEWREMAAYSIDWDKEEAFDENDKFLGYELFSRGELTEDWLKENATLARPKPSNEPSPGEEE